MANEQIKGFMDKVQNDEALRGEVMSVGQGMDTVLDIARREGYEFGADEFMEELNNMGYEMGTQLALEQLDAVAGGTSPHTVTLTSCNGTCWPDCASNSIPT